MYAYTPIADLPADNSSVSYLASMAIAFDPFDSNGHGAASLSYAQVMDELFQDEPTLAETAAQ